MQVKFTAEKRFTNLVPNDKFSQEDIDNLNHCIDEGIESIKNHVFRSEGAYTLTVTANQVIVSADRHEFANCFEDYNDGVSEFNGFVRGIEAIIDNYAIPCLVEKF